MPYLMLILSAQVADERFRRHPLSWKSLYFLRSTRISTVVCWCLDPTPKTGRLKVSSMFAWFKKENSVNRGKSVHDILWLAVRYNFVNHTSNAVYCSQVKTATSSHSKTVKSSSTQLPVYWPVSAGEKRQTHQTFSMTRPKCLMGDFTILYRIYKRHI